MRYRIMTVFLIVVITATGLQVSPASAASNYFVAKNNPGGCSDSWPGTEAQPWCTIQKAANTMTAGDTVYIKRGTYYEEVTPQNSGASDNYISYRNYGNDEVIIDAQDTRHNCIFVSGKKHLRFIGLVLNDTTDYGTIGWGAAFHALSGAEHLILDNITVQNSRFGILLHGESAPVRFVTIKNSSVAHNTSHGIFIYRRVHDSNIGPNNYIAYNDDGKPFFDENGNILPGATYAHGIEIGPAHDEQFNYEIAPVGITIFDNEIVHNKVQGIRPMTCRDVLIRDNHCHHNGATGINLENGPANVVIENNLTEYNAQTFEFETGIWVDDSENVVVKNNVSRGNKLGIIIGVNAKQVIVRNNEFYENNCGAQHLINALGIYVNHGSEHIRVVHNTLHKNGHGDSARGGMTLGMNSTRPSYFDVVLKNNIISESMAPYDLSVIFDSFSADYNNYFNTRSLSVNWQGTNMSWNQYLSASGQDSHSITQNPLFVNHASADFHLQTNSPCIDKGSFLTRATGEGNGTLIPVQDARYFTDGMGLVEGDLIKVGGNNPVRISSVDYVNNRVTVEQSISWNSGDGVSYAYSGSAPDIGAYEYTGVVQPTPTASPTATSPPSTPTQTPTPTNTPTPTATSTPLPTHTPTPTLTNAPTLTSTSTPTPTATNTPTNTPIPTATSTPLPTHTPTNTPTDTPSPTNTPTPRNTPTSVPTNAPAPTNTPLPTSTSTRKTVQVFLPLIIKEWVQGD